MHQKKLALVNDVTGYGRCSIAVALPIVSALKVEGCILPTAILSVHTGFHDYYFDDYTDHMAPYIESWKKNGLTFDGISTGFLGSARQIDIVLDFLRDFKGPHTLAIVDPVMGDNGQLYPSYTQEMCDEMRRLLSYADVVTPNVTEACELLNLPYRSDRDLSEDDFAAMAKALTELRQRSDVKWTYLSPAGDFQADGERTGQYILGGEELTLNNRGESIISYADYAIAMVDEAVSGRHIQQRISVVRR